MTPRSLEHLHKSTTGRIVSAGMRLLDSVAPAAAQRLAFDWFGKPRRRVGPVHAVIAHSLGAAASVIALAEGLGADRAVLIAPPADLPRYAREYARAVGLSARSTFDLLARLDVALGGREAFDLLRL